MRSQMAGVIIETNKLLKFAKDNGDVCLRYPPLGEIAELRIACMFDAAHAVRVDRGSQGGYLVLLTHKDAFCGKEYEYHVLDWRSFRLPRVARSSLSAEAQSAGQATDAVDFIVRFWYLILNPDEPLRSVLARTQFNLEPTFITDAKALYDSYHRTGMNSSSTDKRTSLEIRVTKEQVLSMGGNLRWISSERQFGDGLTKMQTR